jgi:predicted dehydrogenase
VQSGFETPLTQYYRVETTDGWLRAEPTFDVDVEGTTSLTYGVDGREVTEEFAPADHYRLEVEQFADCVAGGESPRIDREESLAHARVLDAVFESAEAGHPVSPVDD